MSTNDDDNFVVVDKPAASPPGSELSPNSARNAAVAFAEALGDPPAPAAAEAISTAVSPPSIIPSDNNDSSNNNDNNSNGDNDGGASDGGGGSGGGPGGVPAAAIDAAHAADSVAGPVSPSVTGRPSGGGVGGSVSPGEEGAAVATVGEETGAGEGSGGTHSLAPLDTSGVPVEDGPGSTGGGEGEGGVSGEGGAGGAGGEGVEAGAMTPGTKAAILESLTDGSMTPGTRRAIEDMLDGGGGGGGGGDDNNSPGGGDGFTDGDTGGIDALGVDIASPPAAKPSASGDDDPHAFQAPTLDEQETALAMAGDLSPRTKAAIEASLNDVADGTTAEAVAHTPPPLTLPDNGAGGGSGSPAAAGGSGGSDGVDNGGEGASGGGGVDSGPALPAGVPAADSPADPAAAALTDGAGAGGGADALSAREAQEIFLAEADDLSPRTRAAIASSLEGTPAAAPVQPFPATTQADAVAVDDDTYTLKAITYMGGRVPIVCQGQNGPCPMIALANVLLLRGAVQVNPDRPILEIDRLLGLLGERLFEANPPPSDPAAAANYEANIEATIGQLPHLTVGLDVNVRFSGPKDFEFTQEMLVFDMLNVHLFHGWIVEPTETETVRAIGRKSYNQVIEDMCTLMDLRGKDELTPEEAEFVNDAMIIEQFLDQNAAQITFHGVCQLHEAMNEGELAVLFRNNHFSTIVKHNGELFSLVTDMGYYDQPQVVWEKLDEIDGDGQFYNADFKPFGSAAPPDSAAMDEDMKFALALQEQERMGGGAGGALGGGGGAPAGGFAGNNPYGALANTPGAGTPTYRQEEADIEARRAARIEESRRRAMDQMNAQNNQRSG